MIDVQRYLEVCKEISGHLGSVLPQVSDDGQPEGPITLDSLLSRIQEKVPSEVIDEADQDTLMAMVFDILLWLSVMGIINRSELSRGTVQIESNLGQSAGRILLEALSEGFQLMDWRSRDPKTIKERVDWLRKLEFERLEGTVGKNRRPIQSRFVAIGLIKGRCEVIDKDVIFFHLKARTNAYGEVIERWEPLSKQITAKDFHREMSSKEALRRSGDVDFLPGRQTVEGSLQKALLRTFEPRNMDWELKTFPSETFPLRILRPSNTQFVLTQYNYFPFLVEWKPSSNEFNLPVRAGVEYKWLTLDYIRRGQDSLNDCDVSTEVFRLIDNHLGDSWESKYLKNLSQIRVPYVKAKHLSDNIKLCLDLQMRTEANVLYSDLNEGEKLIVSNTEKLLLLALRERVPEIESFSDLCKVMNLTDETALQKVKSRLAAKLRKAFGREYIETHKGEGYSFRDNNLGQAAD